MHDINPRSIWQFSSAVVSTRIFKLPVVCFTLQLANKGAAIGGPEEDQTNLGTRLITYRIGLEYFTL